MTRFDDYCARQIAHRALKDARRAARQDHLDRRIPVLDPEFDNLLCWS